MKKTKIFVGFVLVAVLASAAWSQQSSKYEMLFEKAKYTMETKGDLQGALKLFDEIIEKYPEEREYSAKAQLYIGLCYEKLGRTEAEKAFHKVLDNYPEQKEIVQLARTKLDNLQLSVSGRNQEDKGLHFRQIWADPPETYGGGISPNNRYISFIHWETVEMAIHDLETEETWDVTDEGTWLEESYQFPDASVWSPDSRKIAYFWFLGKGENTRTELRLIDIQGGAYRIITQGGYFNTMMAPYPMCWSPDGKTIWAVRGLPDKNIEGSKSNQMTWDREIVSVSVEDGSVKSVYTLGKRGLLTMDISPDGRFLACGLWQEEELRFSDIHIFSTDGSKDRIVAQHSARDWAPKWSVDGKSIIFISKRTGSEGLWALSVENGQPQGEPILIKEGLPASMTPLGISDAGVYYYSISSRLSDLYTAEMDMETGRLISQPIKVKTGLEKLSYKPLWTPDGKTLIYMSHRLDMFQPWLGGTDIVLHDIETDQERIIHVEDFFIHPEILWYYPTLTSDGRALIGHREPHIANEEFFKIDLENDDVEVLKAQPPDKMEEMGYWPRLSEDGQTLYYLTGDTKAIVRYDITSKEETEIFRSDSAIYYIAFSPDLKEVVFRYWFHNPNELWWLSLEGGDPKLLGALDSDERIRFPVWTPDGKYVLFPTLNSEKLYRVRIDGEKDLLECELDMKDRRYPQVHPDSKRIAFTQIRGNYQEVWAIENIVPESTEKKE